jgi:hypothetical protein
MVHKGQWFEISFSAGMYLHVAVNFFVVILLFQRKSSGRCLAIGLNYIYLILLLSDIISSGEIHKGLKLNQDIGFWILVVVAAINMISVYLLQRNDIKIIFKK